MSLNSPPRRVVSLVPSVTESLFDLGLGGAVVGITDYCIHPAQALAGLPRLGGPKNPRLPEILALAPDLVLANQEENTRLVVEALQEAGVPVYLSFPQNVDEALSSLQELARIFHAPAAAQKINTLESAVGWMRAASAGTPAMRTFCPIWFDSNGKRDPWFMTFNHQTYCHDLLALAGGANVFAGRQRRYPLGADLGLEPAQDPGERDTRYPRVTLSEVIAASPEIILLPDEPFAFNEDHKTEIRRLLEETPAVKTGRVHRVDGSLITWHGTRLAKALQELPWLFQV